MRNLSYMSSKTIKIDMMHIAKPVNIILGMYMHEQNDMVEIPSLYVFLSTIIHLSILLMCYV
jgi:hypothetical protein